MATSKSKYKQKNSGSETVKNTTRKILKYSRKGEVEKLTRALEKHKDLINCTDDHKQTPLYHAAYNGRVKCLKELLKRGANPNQ